MNVCIIGNSHVAALKSAWDVLTPQPEVDIKFFASRGNSLSALGYHNGTLSTEVERINKFLAFTSGGETKIHLKNFDVFFLYGIGATPYKTKNITYSSSAIKTALYDFYSTKLFYSLLELIRSGSDSKIYIGHKPLTASPHSNQSTASLSNYDSYCDSINIVNENLLNQLCCQMLPQPIDTLSHGADSTKVIYARGSKRLSSNEATNNIEHPETDYGHMNEKYGNMYLRGLLTAVTSTQDLANS